MESFNRALVFVAHPDDETIACSGLLQRTAASLVVFAVDGAPPRYGFEGRFVSLQKYSETRFLEASRALALIPGSAFRRLRRRDGCYFVDQHLFQDLREALASLLQIVEAFSPDVLVSHAYEGGHIDHDACSFLAMHAARTLGLKHLEFPLYWKSESGRDVVQEFRGGQDGELVLELSSQEIAVKERMLAEYGSQQGLLQVFRRNTEHFRPAAAENYALRALSDYAFENRRGRLRAKSFLQKVSDLEDSLKVYTML
jgi:LmbE family N-acetylglucosaminyl deacetylase